MIDQVQTYFLGQKRQKFKDIKTEEEFYDLLDKEFPAWQDIQIDDTIFEYENFWPGNKCVNEGAWIKVKNKEGYNVYYAKPARRVYNPLTIKNKLEKLILKAPKIINSLSKINMSSTDTNLEDVKIKLDNSNKLIEEKRKLMLQLDSITIFDHFNTSPYYVKIQKTKTTYEYLLPSQYELTTDIQLYIDAVNDNQNSESVKFHNIFKSNNEDIIFYMQSRGIPKDKAIMLANLKDGYFKINTQALLNEALIFKNN